MLVEIIVLALVAYRIWRLLGVDTILDRVRPDWAWLACPWCLGFWVTMGLALLGSWLGYISSDWIVVGLAASALVGLLGRLDQA